YDRHVADTANVLQGAPIVAGEEDCVGDRDERSALPSRRDVAHAEIADDVDADSLGDHGGFPELPGGVRRFVPDGLTVRTDGTHVGARYAGFGQHGDGCV